MQIIYTLSSKSTWEVLNTENGNYCKLLFYSDKNSGFSLYWEVHLL